MTTHYDVGKREPIAFCNGDEYATCADEWLTVTCPACHAKRAPQKAPLSRGERDGMVRATGADTTRPLSKEELAADLEAMHGQGWRGDWYKR